MRGRAESDTRTVILASVLPDEFFAEVLRSQREFRSAFKHWKRRAYLPRDF